jgi:hypothetical protein
VGKADATPDAESQVATAAGPLQSGQLLADRYLVGAELGRGVGAVVYQAVDQRAGLSVALKVLHADRRSEALYRELRFGRALHHPHVCRLHDVFEASGQVFLVMEHAAGGTLRTTLAGRRARDPVADARAVIAGLAAIHRAGLVHRDLKPENILRLGDGRIVISDFGLSRAIEQATATTAGLGTPGYLAPEILVGGKVDQASDVWSLGVVLHEILAGCRPGWGQTVRARLPSRLTRHPEIAALARVCRACLEVDRRARPPTGAAVETLLETTLHTELRASRVRRAVTAVGACLLGAVSFAVVRLTPAPVPTEPVAINLGEDWSRARLLFRPPWRETLRCMQAVGPDRRVVRISHYLPSPATVVDIDIDSGQRRPAAVDPQTYLIDCPSLSPDGRALLFTRRSGAITQVMYARRPDGRQGVALVEGSGATWLPSGKEFLFVTAGQAVALGDLQGRVRPLARTEPAPPAVQHLAVDDRGEVAAASAGSWLELYDLRRRRQIDRRPLEVDPGGQITFDGRRRTFLVPTLQAGGTVLAELPTVPGGGRLSAAGHLPGMSLLAAESVPGGRLLTAVRPGKGQWFLLRPDGSQHLVGSVWMVAADVSKVGPVAYLDSPAGPDSDVRRLLIWRPGPPATTQVLFEGRGLSPPLISGDGELVVYYRTPEREFHLCDRAGCRLVHLDPALHNLPPPGPIGPDGDALPYFAMAGAPGEPESRRSKVLRVVFLRSGGVLELGPLEATCRVVWASERTFWVLADSDPVWREVDLWSGRRTARTWPRDPAQPCYGLPPGDRTGHFVRLESRSELRFLPDA